MLFKVQESEKFKAELEEAVLWLYSHNLEMSEEFAEQKYFELQQEMSALKNHLQHNPRMGQADTISGLRRFPLYDGRYLVTWLIIDERQAVILLEFMDSKYPQALRTFYSDE